MGNHPHGMLLGGIVQFAVQCPGGYVFSSGSHIVAAPGVGPYVRGGSRPGCFIAGIHKIDNEFRQIQIVVGVAVVTCKIDVGRCLCQRMVEDRGLG